MKRFTGSILLLLLVACNIMAQPGVIAHRGFWDTDGSAQNSIAALVKADSIGCYGSEFDVRLSSDDELVVNHDPVYKCKLINKTTAATLHQLKLKNKEPLPYLSDYLKAAEGLNTRLILELKALNSPEKESIAVGKIIALVRTMNLEKRMVYISFSLHATKELARLAPAGTPIYYLNGDLSPKELKRTGCTGPNYNLNVYREHPEWISESHAEGLKVATWTVNKEQDMEWAILHKIDYITTDNPVLLQELLSSKKNL